MKWPAIHQLVKRDFLSEAGPFFLLVDKPEVYNLPPDPVAPAKSVEQGWRAMALAGFGMVAVAALSVLSARGGRR